MLQDSFPDSGPDDTEPDSDAPGPQQGLFITLPAEELTLAGFAQNGQADTMAPGALLATIVDAVTGEDGSGLAGCSDDQLLGIISGARRQECRNAWILLTAIKEFARRAGTDLEGAEMTSSVSGRYSGLSRVVPGRRFGAQPLVPSAVFSQR